MPWRMPACACSSLIVTGRPSQDGRAGHQPADDYEALLAQAPEAELGMGVTRRPWRASSTLGGTTGASKGVMLSHRNLIANTTNWLIAMQQGPEDTYLIMAPCSTLPARCRAGDGVGGRPSGDLTTFAPVVRWTIAAKQVTITLGCRP